MRVTELDGLDVHFLGTIGMGSASLPTVNACVSGGQRRSCLSLEMRVRAACESASGHGVSQSRREESARMRRVKKSSVVESNCVSPLNEFQKDLPA